MVNDAHVALARPKDIRNLTYIEAECVAQYEDRALGGTQRFEGAEEGERRALGEAVA